MDIGELLAAADQEVAYEKDAFEEIQQTSKPEETITEVLKSAAQAVIKEDRAIAEAGLRESAQEIQHELNQSQREKEADYDDFENPVEKNVIHSKEIPIRYSSDESDNGGNRVSSSPQNPPNTEKVIVIEEESEDEEDEEDEDDADDDAEDNEVHIACKQLIFACVNGKLREAERLLESKGAKIKYADSHGWNAIHWTAAKGDTEIMEYLITYYRRKWNGKANTDKKIRQLLQIRDGKLAGWTALHIAAVCCHYQMVKLLLNYGVSKSRKDRMGEIPFEVVGKGKAAKVILKLLDPKPPNEQEEKKHED
jgi:hypothetical protein